MSNESLSSEQSRELKALFESRFSKLFRWLSVVLAVVTLCLVLWVAISSRQEIRNDLLQSRADLLANKSSWGVSLVESFDQKHYWLQRHGISLEISLFEKLGVGLFSSAALVESGSTSLLFSIFLSLHDALLRVVFLLLASWRLWAAVAIVAALYARRHIHPHLGHDLLGETGNGRMYYSGILAHLDHVDSRGAPTQQVSGLACPQSVGIEAIKKSELYALLQDYEALNETNTILVGIILHYHSLPGYLAERDELRSMDDVWSALPLPEYTEHWLVAALRRQARWKDVEGVGDQEADHAYHPEGAFEASIDAALGRVLTNNLKKELTKIDATIIATLVLAHQAAKAMIYKNEGSRWSVKSRFPELSARAVLHSIPAFSKEYNTFQRTWLRRALVFASRKSVFSPVRMPVDLSPETKALRNWSELMLGAPQRLSLSADEVELVALLDELHERWNKYFFDAVVKPDLRLVKGAYAARSNLIFIPVSSLVEVFGSLVKQSEFDRLTSLSTFVAQKSKLDSLGNGANEDGIESKGFDRPLSQIGFLEIKEISRKHDISDETIHKWSTFRAILHAYGWLARRVGEYTVPDSSIIFTVFDTEGSPMEKSPEANSNGLIGAVGMVPLRASRLETRWGTAWTRFFKQVGSASMAETRDDYDRLLRAEKRSLPEDLTVAAID